MDYWGYWEVRTEIALSRGNGDFEALPIDLVSNDDELPCGEHFQTLKSFQMGGFSGEGTNQLHYQRNFHYYEPILKPVSENR